MRQNQTYLSEVLSHMWVPEQWWNWYITNQIQWQSCKFIYLGITCYNIQEIYISNWVEEAQRYSIWKIEHIIIMQLWGKILNNHDILYFFFLWFYPTRFFLVRFIPWRVLWIMWISIIIFQHNHISISSLYSPLSFYLYYLLMDNIWLL